jgi:hypothetical protein
MDILILNQFSQSSDWFLEKVKYGKNNFFIFESKDEEERFPSFLIQKLRSHNGTQSSIIT